MKLKAEDEEIIRTALLEIGGIQAVNVVPIDGSYMVSVGAITVWVEPSEMVRLLCGLIRVTELMEMKTCSKCGESNPTMSSTPIRRWPVGG